MTPLLEQIEILGITRQTISGAEVVDRRRCFVELPAYVDEMQKTPVFEDWVGYNEIDALTGGPLEARLKLSGFVLRSMTHQTSSKGGSAPDASLLL